MTVRRLQSRRERLPILGLAKDKCPANFHEINGVPETAESRELNER